MTDPFDDDTQPDGSEPDIVKVRNHAKDLERQLAEEKTAREAAEARVVEAEKRTVIEQVMSARGLSGRYVNLALKDIDGDITPEAVTKWVDELGAPAIPQTTITDETVPGEERIANANLGGTPPTDSTAQEKAAAMLRASSQDEVIRIARESGVVIAE